MLIIINPAAAKARRAWPTIKNQLHTAGIDYQFHETTAAGDATLRTRAALESGTEFVAVVGGDGTLSEVAEGFFQFNCNPDIPPAPINSSATLAILPAGTGDDFARGLRRGRAPLQEWLETLISHSHGTSNAQHVDVLYG